MSFSHTNTEVEFITVEKLSFFRYFSKSLDGDAKLSFMFVFCSGSWITTTSLCWRRTALRTYQTPCCCWNWTGTIWTPFLPKPSNLTTFSTCKWPGAYHTCESSGNSRTTCRPSLNILPAVIGRDLSRNRLRRIKSLSFNGLPALRSLNMQRNRIVRLLDGAFWGLSKLDILWVHWCCDSIRKAHYIFYFLYKGLCLTPT